MKSALIFLITLSSCFAFAAEPTPAPAPTPTPPPAPAAPEAEKPQYSWTVEDVKNIALQNNPDLKSARANFEAASKEIGVAVSGYLPHVDVWAKFDQTTLPSPSAGSTPQLGISLPYKVAAASFNQVLFDFGKQLSRINASRMASSAAEQDSIALKNAVLLAVQRAFYDVQSAIQLVEVAKKGVAKYEETYRRTDVLVRTGAKPKFDLSQARVELDKAKLGLINAENTAELGKVALLNIMGMEGHLTFELKESPPTTPHATSDTLKLPTLLNRALAARPEMKRQEDELASARYNLGGQVREYLPTISVQGWYGKYLPDYPPSLRDAWGIGVYGTWHVFQGLETTFRVGELSARVDQQEALSEKARLGITAEVTRALRDLTRSESNLTVANEALDSARENLTLAQKRYDANVATILELLTAEGSMLSAEATQVTARYDHEIAFATLERAVNAPLTE